MVNRKTKKENQKIDPRCPTSNMYIFQKELIKKRMRIKFSPPEK